MKIGFKIQITYQVPPSNHRCWWWHPSEVVYDCYIDDEAATPVSLPGREKEGVEAPTGADYVWIGDGGGASGGTSVTISLKVGIMWIPYQSG